MKLHIAAVTKSAFLDSFDEQGCWEATRIPIKGEGIIKEAVTSWVCSYHCLSGFEAVRRVWWCLPSRKKEAETPMRTGKLTYRGPETVDSPWHPSGKETWAVIKDIACICSQKKDKNQGARGQGQLPQCDMNIIIVLCSNLESTDCKERICKTVTSTYFNDYLCFFSPKELTIINLMTLLEKGKSSDVTQKSKASPEAIQNKKDGEKPSRKKWLSQFIIIMV